MKYIDAEKLKVEINGIIAAVKVKNHPDEFGSIEQCMAAAEIEALNLALDCIKELQQEQPGVDLEKDIDAFFYKWDKNSHGCLFDENGKRVTIETIKRVLKHFLNARKEDK